jgi:hypothetical protein
MIKEQLVHTENQKKRFKKKEFDLYLEMRKELVKVSNKFRQRI